MSPIAQF
jgi:hypothetical protein